MPDLREELDRFQRIFDALSDSARQAAQEHTPSDLLDRAQTVGEYAMQVVESTPPYLVTTPLIDELRAGVQQAAENLEAFAEDENTAHLDNSNSYVDAILGVAHSWPVVAPIRDGRRAASAFVKATDARQRELLQDLGDLEAGLARARDETNVIAQDTRTTLEQRKVEVDQQLEQVQTTVEQEQTRIGDAVTRLESQFSADQDKRRTESRSCSRRPRSPPRSAANSCTRVRTRK